jgi:hypothetical protein
VLGAKMVAQDGGSGCWDKVIVWHAAFSCCYESGFGHIWEGLFFGCIAVWLSESQGRIRSTS